MDPSQAPWPSRFTRHAFLCTSGSDCGPKTDAVALHKAFKELLRHSGRKETLRINQSGCLGQCGHGPILVVYPEGVWYSHLALTDVERIFHEHLVGGKVCADLLYRTPRGGTNLSPPPGGSQPGAEACTRCPAVPRSLA